MNNTTNILAALEEIRTYLHERADSDENWKPNRELCLQGKLEEIIAELGAAQIAYKP